MLESRPAVRWKRITAGSLVVALLAGCSSAPRKFTPRLAEQPGDTSAFKRADGSCKDQVAAGKREQFEHDRGTSAGVGTAVGVGIAAASVAGTGTSMVAAAAAGTAAAASLLIFAPIAIFATSRYIRSGKEAEIKQAMTTCLADNGYAVSEWQLAPEE